jgi:hypothetical protein
MLNDVADDCTEAAKLWASYAELEVGPSFSRGDSKHYAKVFKDAARRIRELELRVAVINLAALP